MFTGIINNVGKIKTITKNRLIVGAESELLSQLTDGMSVAVNGICLTVVSFDKTSFAIEFMPETQRKTNIASLQENSLVNLELPASPHTFLAGHIVQGHVDGTASIQEIKNKGNSRLITLSAEKGLGKYIVAKGSIALNGISLTIIDIIDDVFTVGIIPYTWDNTMLHSVAVGTVVNVEVDIVAKYVEKLLKKE